MDLRAVAVADPKHHREKRVIDAVTAKRPDQVKCEERQPAKDEHSDDDGESFGS